MASVLVLVLASMLLLAIVKICALHEYGTWACAVMNSAPSLFFCTVRGHRNGLEPVVVLL